jgi:hypothetical protein
MADGRHYPDRWNEYRKIKNRDPRQLDPKWITFAARYRVASAYHSVSFFGLTNDLKCLYSALMHLPLALSALEAACKASNLKLDSVTINGHGDSFIKISKDIRNYLISILRDDSIKDSFHDGGAILERAENCLREKNSDIIPIVLALRHILFSGSWSPADSKGIFARVALLIEEFCRLILIKSDQIFEEFLIRERQL